MGDWVDGRQVVFPRVAMAVYTLTRFSASFYNASIDCGLEFFLGTMRCGEEPQKRSPQEVISDGQARSLIVLEAQGCVRA